MPRWFGPGALAGATGTGSGIAGGRSRSDSTALGLAPAHAIDLADVQFRRKVDRFHALGSRTLAEYLLALGARRLLRQVIEADIDAYIGRPDAVTVAAGGGFAMPPLPLHLVRDGGSE
jgi:hypothetical protein